MKNFIRYSKTVAVWTMFILAVVSFMRSAKAETESSGRSKTGLGIVLGEPTGFTGKFWIDHIHAVDVGTAFSFSDFVLVYADYLAHFPRGFGTSSQFLSELIPYVGIGGELFFASVGRGNDRYYSRARSSEVGIGVRVPLGIEYMIPRSPLGTFLEIVPGVGLAPSTFGFIHGGIGIRYYF